MVKYVLLCVAMLVMTGCVSHSHVATGGQTDKNGCLPASGQSFSLLKQQCVQVFDIADIKLPDPINPSLAVYVILSEDRSQAEMFWASKGGVIVLDSVKGGYLSKDGSIRLLRQGNEWKIRY